MKKIFYFFCLFFFVCIGCIKDDLLDDYVDPVVQITSSIDTLAFGSSFQLEAKYLNNVGAEEQVKIQWASSNPDIISVSDEGLATAISEGSSNLSAEYNTGSAVLRDEVLVHVGENTVLSDSGRKGSIMATSNYTLTGDFVLKEEGDKLSLSFDENYKASSNLPGLYVYLTNNRNSIADAIEIGAVTTFEGAHSYLIENVGINEFNYLLYYCKPFNVKVGDGEIN